MSGDSTKFRECRHIIDNFALFGFGSPGVALLQTAKELIENSIDACRNMQSASVRVVLHLHAVEKYLELEVCDSGCGMEDPKAFLSCFSTSKSPDSDGSFQTGKFGLGLSACLLFSLVKTAQPMRIVTKINGAFQSTITDFSFNMQTGEPTIVQRTVIIRLPWIANDNELNQGKVTVHTTYDYD